MPIVDHRVRPSPDRNLLKAHAPRSLSTMALRALVFSSDGSTTSALCHVLTDLGIEAEICSEMLVAVERITSQPYNALLVDWDQQAEAIFLVKQLRELKLAAQALILAIVQNDEDLPQALQAGANSVIRKPIDPHQAHDTMATAKQLILARQPLPKQTETALADTVADEAQPQSEADSDQPPVSSASMPTPAEGGFAIDDPANFNAAEEAKPKRGFLQQTAHRSALEAEQSVGGGELPAAESSPAPPRPAVPDPAARERALSFLGYGPKAEPSSTSPTKNDAGTLEDFAAPPPAAAQEPRSQDVNREFSSLPEDFERNKDSADEADPGPRHTRYGFYAAAAALLIAGCLWVFAPGDSYVARLKNFHLPRPNKTHPATSAPVADAHPTTRVQPSKPEEPILPDPSVTQSEDEESSNIQIIENKPMPIAGAQQPPTSDAPPGAQPVITPDPSTASATQSNVPAPVSAEATSSSHPQIQPAAATQISPAPAPSTALPPAPQVAAPSAAHAPDSPPSDPSAARPAVIIPESLKNFPSASSIKTLEPSVVPEETSRSMLLKQVDPDYPPIAIPQRLEGTVILQVFVGPDGAVRDIKLVRGYFVLGRSAFDAVRQWRFKPYIQNGKPTDFQTYITITFKLPT